jgi:hypothetical protein
MTMLRIIPQPTITKKTVIYKETMRLFLPLVRTNQRQALPT